eukprot:135562_1
MGHRNTIKNAIKAHFTIKKEVNPHQNNGDDDDKDDTKVQGDVRYLYPSLDLTQNRCFDTKSLLCGDDEEDEDKEDDEDDEDAPLKSTMHKSKSCGAQPKRHMFDYNPDPFSTKRSVRMPKKLTQVVIPECVKELIADAYDFITKITAMVLLSLSQKEYDDYVVDVGDHMILNYGFHDRNTGEVLYLVAVKGCNNVYTLGDVLYTKRALCDIYQLHHHQLPKSWHQQNDMKHMMNQVNYGFNETFRLSYLCSVQWHRLPIFRVMNNKQRITFSITKPEFIECLKNWWRMNKNCTLIPIIMFNGNGYRVEYVQIVRIRDGIDIGVSYVYRNGFQATGIHLNKAHLLRQHQLADPHHKCHCLDGFESIIDDLHIGNADDDKNRVKDLQNKYRILKQKHNSCESQDNLVNQLRSENAFLKNEINPLKGQLQCLNNLLLLHMSQRRPSTSNSTLTPPSGNFLRLTP